MQIGIGPEAAVVIITATIIKIHKDKIVIVITSITETTIPEGITTEAGIITSIIETIITILMVVITLVIITITLATATITGVVIIKAKAEAIIIIIITETIIIIEIIIIGSIMWVIIMTRTRVALSSPLTAKI